MGVGQHGALPHTGQQAIPRIERELSLDLKSDCFWQPLLMIIVPMRYDFQLIFFISILNGHDAWLWRKQNTSRAVLEKVWSKIQLSSIAREFLSTVTGWCVLTHPTLRNGLLTVNTLAQVDVYEDSIKILWYVPILFGCFKVSVISAQHGFIMRRVLFEKMLAFSQNLQLTKFAWILSSKLVL
jgi:hypothetical protein